MKISAFSYHETFSIIPAYAAYFKRVKDKEFLDWVKQIARPVEGKPLSQWKAQIGYYQTKEFYDKTKQELILLLEKSETEPVLINDEHWLVCGEKFGPTGWFFKGKFYNIENQNENYSQQQKKLLILEHYDKDRKKWEKLNHLYGDDRSEDVQSVNGKYVRQNIPEKVRIEVWRRDDGKCAKCGSRERLEYDHIVPVSRGGANTARNIELLCEKCNREKYNNIQ